MPARVAWSVLLLPGGMAVGHVLGYRLAALWGAPAPAPTAGHGYLQALLLLAAPFLTIVLVRSFLGGARAGGITPIRFASLAAAQIGLYVAVELTEFAAAGIDPLAALVEPSLVIGVVAQVIVAAVLSTFARAAHRAGAWFAATVPAPTLHPTRPWRPESELPNGFLVSVWSLSRRGPPAGVCIASRD
jgi:hypothetical protein